MSFNLKCFFVGHRTYRTAEQDYFDKDGKAWTRSSRIELVACERCGSLNPNHPGYDLLGAATLTSKVIDKAKRVEQ